MAAYRVLRLRCRPHETGTRGEVGELTTIVARHRDQPPRGVVRKGDCAGTIRVGLVRELHCEIVWTAVVFTSRLWRLIFLRIGVIFSDLAAYAAASNAPS